MSARGFSVPELLAAVVIVLVLAGVIAGSGMKVYESASLATSANNIRSLAAGGLSYLAENNNTYWPWRFSHPNRDVTWWFGFESWGSQQGREGTRSFDPEKGPLAGYVPKGLRPDPSFAMKGGAFKPKYQAGYIGIGYNALLGGAMEGLFQSRNPQQAENWKLVNHGQLSNPAEVVVFCTSAQVAFQPPASPTNPMIEEFYGIDHKEITVHFRHNGKALVSFATGNVGFLEMDESTRDNRMPRANVGRFAPVGDTKFLR